MTLPMSGTVYVDAQIFVYTVENNPAFAPPLRTFWTAVGSNQVRVITSELTLLETRVIPLRSNDQRVLAAYQLFFAQSSIELKPVSRSILFEAAELRASSPRLRTPDAIHVATAIHAGCNTFLTNDGQLRGFSKITTTFLRDAMP